MNHAARGARPAAVRVHEAGQEPVTELRYEGLVTRGIAFAIDAAIIDLVAIVVAGAVALALSVLSVSKDSLDTVLIAVGGVLFLAWSVGYFVTFWSTTGQTPGSRLMRIKVCADDDDGGVLRPRRAALRFAGLVLAAIPLLAGFLPILFDERRRGLHDMLAGTVVVEDPELSPGSEPSRPRTPHR
jgi:uncharacterized RDD family membrane protein YckC